MSATLTTITESNFQSEVVSSTTPVLVDFWAEWCGPCKALTPILEMAAKELGDTAKIGKVNVDENPQLAAQFRVQSIPALFIMKGGQVVDSWVGGRSKDVIVSKLKEHA